MQQKREQNVFFSFFLDDDGDDNMRMQRRPRIYCIHRFNHHHHHRIVAFKRVDAYDNKKKQDTHTDTDIVSLYYYHRPLIFCTEKCRHNNNVWNNMKLSMN